jgi:hypothetical protein
VVGLVAGGAVLATAGRGGPSAQTPATQPQTTEEPTSTTTPPTSRVPIGNISISLPPGWGWFEMQLDLPASTRGVCVAPVGNSGPSFEGCSGVMIFSGDPLPGYQGAPYEQDGQWQFAHEAGPIPCPFDDSPGSTIEPGQAGRAPIDGGYRDVGDRRAAWNRWYARCDNEGTTFTPEAWLLPQSKILIVDVIGHEETKALLESVEFGPA